MRRSLKEHCVIVYCSCLSCKHALECLWRSSYSAYTLHCIHIVMSNFMLCYLLDGYGMNHKYDKWLKLYIPILEGTSCKWPHLILDTEAVVLHALHRYTVQTCLQYNCMLCKYMPIIIKVSAPMHINMP